MARLKCVFELFRVTEKTNELLKSDMEMDQTLLFRPSYCVTTLALNKSTHIYQINT
jgi:hypothetical protein